MRVWIVAIGSELLTPFRIDTNSLAITERLNAIGGDVQMKFVVGDNLAALADVFRRAAGTVDLVVCTGGLGPTADDITRDALVEAFGLAPDVDEAIVEGIRRRFERRGLTMPDINRRQAVVPRGATVLENTRGTAPGLLIERAGTTIVLLPGPPREMTPMLERLIADRLQSRSAGRGLFRRVLKITGLTESDVDARAQPVYGRWIDAPVPIATTILAAMGQIELHLSVTAETPVAGHTLDSAVAELREVLGTAIFSTDGRPLEAMVGEQLRGRGYRIAVAESCSGGLLSSRLTDVPGSSDYFDRGAVCYSNQAKIDWLGVSEASLAAHGAVSEPVAREMARGIRDRTGAQVGVGVTGIAGPGGGSEQKPVGTVVVAVITPEDERVRTLLLFGGRDLIKFQSAQAAMNMLRLMLGDR
jgi:nicotinamide-nucleotide amidase